MTDTLPEGITRSEFDELKGSVKDLADALKAQETARTSAQKEEAREDVKEAKADLDALAKELGISPKSLKDAAEQARRQERKEELRPLLVELLDEELADEDEADADKTGDKPDGEPAGGDKETSDHDDEDTPPKDTEPRAEHWSERAVGNLLG